MFVRRKQNSSGTISIQVIAKVGGKYRVQKSFGSSRNEAALQVLEQKAKQWADEHEFGESLFAPEGAAEYDSIMASIGQNQLRLVGSGGNPRWRSCLTLSRRIAKMGCPIAESSKGTAPPICFCCFIELSLRQAK